MTTCNINELIDRQRIGAFQITTFSLCGMVLVLDGYDTQSIGYLLPAMSESFGLPPQAFTPVITAGLVGLMIGSFSFGAIADRIGRRWTVIASTLLFGLFTLSTAFATSLTELIVLRFLTGLGLGGAIPNVIAVTSEFAPKRLQSVTVAWLMAGMPIGSILAGLASMALIPIWGWQAVFYLGGTIPLLLAVLLTAQLPESARFLVTRRGAPSHIAALMRRIAPTSNFGPSHVFVASADESASLPARHLFSAEKRSGTLLIWWCYFMSLLMIYFVVSWLPAILHQANLSGSAGLLATTLFSAGGAFGTLVTGRILIVSSPRTVVYVEFWATALLISALALNHDRYWLTLALCTALGATAQGAQAALNAFAAAYYPTPIRSTGIGWGLAVGRVGSIVGPLLGGLMLALEWSVQSILLAGAIPATCGAIAMFAGWRIASEAVRVRA